MIYKFFSVLVLAACVVSPVQIQAAEDIAQTTRESSVIAAQIVAIQAQLEKVSRLLGASVVTSQPDFIITIDEQTVVAKPITGMTTESARSQCERVAYNTDHMWKLVTCTFGSQVLYRDVFIAG